jgi:phosphate transport system protein
MTYYKQQVENDIKAIRMELKDVAENVCSSIETAIVALCEHNKAKLYNVILDDPHVNRQTKKIDQMCHSFIARHLPAAGQLRFISSTLRLTIALERIGDYGSTLSRIAIQLESSPQEEILEDIKEVARRACKMLRKSIVAFVNLDVKLAKKTALSARKVDKRHDKFFIGVVGEKKMISLQTFRLLTIMSKLERVSDQAKNICEEVFFSSTGGVKEKKAASILFVDERNNFLSPLAMALAKKSFPNSGIYYSAGWQPDSEPSELLKDTSEKFALDLEEFTPTKLKPFRQVMAKYKIIITFNLEDPSHIDKIPFHSVHINWTLDIDKNPDELVHQLSQNIYDIMFRLCGDNAD